VLFANLFVIENKLFLKFTNPYHTVSQHWTYPDLKPKRVKRGTTNVRRLKMIIIIKIKNIETRRRTRKNKQKKCIFTFMKIKTRDIYVYECLN
jgi:hypothetical protein